MIVKIVVGSVVGLVTVSAMAVHIYKRGREDQHRVDNDVANEMIRRQAARERVAFEDFQRLMKEAVEAASRKNATA